MVEIAIGIDPDVDMAELDFCFIGCHFQLEADRYFGFQVSHASPIPLRKF